MLQVLLPSADVDNNIIKEDQYKISQMTMEDVVHLRLESFWGIGQSKGHHQKLKIPIVTYERCLGDILLPYLDPMILRSQINLGEVFRSPQLIHEFLFFIVFLFKAL